MSKDLNKKLATAALAGLMTMGMFATAAVAADSTAPVVEKDKDAHSCKDKTTCKDKTSCKDKDKAHCNDKAHCTSKDKESK